MRNDALILLSRRRRRQRQRSKFWGRARTVLIFLCAAAVLSLVGLFASFGYAYTRVAENMPNLDDYSSQELAQTSVVYDANGNVVDELYGVQNRFVVSMDEIDPSLRKAIVAIEDHRFYQHRGLDFEAIARAAQQNIVSMSIQEGGSTITQQLIKNTYIAEEQRYVPSFQRKITEASLAWQYEKEHSKREILEQYLNTVYFGQNAYGAEAAARTYFDKSADDLTLPESAMIAGIVNLPGLYDPFTDPESARARRDVVLDMMLKYGSITKEEHDRAVETDLNVSRGRIEYENDNEYFLNAVRKELAEEYGDDMVYGGGLKIRTTLDPNLQERANTSVDGVVDPSAGDPSASLVSIDPATGAVRSMVGGSDFEQIKFNLATQAHRQPGSSFKAFVLAEAIDRGISPETLYESKDLRIKLPRGSEERFYKVRNYANKERGPITIEEATEQSDNTVFVQLALDLGMENVVEMAHELGVESELDPYPSTAIGGLRIGVTPLEMASAYSTFANGGVHMEPYLIEEVTREKNGEEVTVEEHRPKGERVLSRDEAAAVNQVLRGVVTDGTASYYHKLDQEIGRPSAGKTGTTERFVDAWFVGYIPQLTTSVWVGYPDGNRSMVNINGLEEINGENYPLDIWSRYMRGAAERFPRQGFNTPSPDLDLEKKTDGRAYVKPPKSTGETTSAGSVPGFTFPGTGSSALTTTPEATTPVPSSPGLTSPEPPTTTTPEPVVGTAQGGTPQSRPGSAVPTPAAPAPGGATAPVEPRPQGAFQGTPPAQNPGLAPRPAQTLVPGEQQQPGLAPRPDANRSSGGVPGDAPSGTPTGGG